MSGLTSGEPEPADDVAAARLEQNKVARREADGARRRRLRASDATATLRCVWSGLLWHDV